MAPFRSWSRGATRVTTVVALVGIALVAVLETRIGSPPVAPAAPALLPPPGDTATVYGPVVLSTPNGNATNHTESFAVSVIPGKRYILRLTNGDGGGGHKVTSGTVRLNGWETITSAELGSGNAIDKVVQARSADTLFATVQGGAGAYVTVSVLETGDASFIVFGPEHFVRTTGTPVTELRPFTISPTAAPPYRLCLKNGEDNGANRVSSATVLVNDQEAFSPSNFNNQVASLMAQVTLQQANTLSVTLAGQPGGFVDICVTATDTTPPVIANIAPPQNFVTRDTLVTVSGTVQDETPTTVKINGDSAPVTNGAFSKPTLLPVEGHNTIHIVATDRAGHVTDSARVIIRDRINPVLTVTAPPEGFITKLTSVVVSGTVQDSTQVTVNVNGTQLLVDQGAFSGPIALPFEGLNTLTITATDAAGNQAVVPRTVRRDTIPPVLAVNQPAENDSVTTASVTVSGTVTDSTLVTLTVNGTGVTVGQGGAYSTSVTLVLGLNTITVVATDQATNSTTVQRHVFRKNPLPPDPATVASVVNPAEATLIKENTSFLYTGTSPIQAGVDTATIKFLRAAVLRGRVLTRQLQPLGGVVVKLKDHTEFGQTLSRDDGRYDLVVNGGGSLVLTFTLGGYLPAQRSIEVPWQDYTNVDDVILIQPDPVVTAVDLSSPNIQVAQGSQQTDADGSRQATALFEPGTQATLQLPNGGGSVPLTSLNVRATEFTVGSRGDDAMPALLPASSQYTYAVQITADSQLAVPGSRLTFNQPVPVYVQNFLDFPVGTAVPVGAYDPDSAKWLPRPNGVVLRIIGTDAQGRATIDINGDGLADSDGLLLVNGLDSLERVKLAGTFPADSRLWRVPIIEGLPEDLNWPFTLLGGDEPKTRITGPCGSEGADVLRCNLQVQTAFQSVGIVGSPFTLNYASDRTKGNVADRQLKIDLVGATIPAFLQRVDLEVNVAGRLFEASFSPVANLSYTFTWDGKDAYGRTAQATQPATVRVGYLYPVVYSRPAPAAQSFGKPCTLTSGDCTLDSIPPIQDSVRALRRVWEGTQTTIGGFDATGVGLGGFTLDVQHAYDPLGGILYSGDGTRRVAATLPDQITRWAGNGNSGGASTPAVNGLNRLAAQIDNPAGIVVAPDGSVILSEPFRGRVLKISTDGIISTVAGLPTGPIADSGTATALKIGGPQGIALGPDGSVYFAEQGLHRIRQVTPQGFMRTIAGDGTCGFVGDTGLAKAARVCGPTGLAIAPDGSIYFADQSNLRIRRIGPDRRISTVAGLGLATQCFLAGSGSWPPPPPQDFINICKDGGPASQAPLRLIGALTVGPDGSVYFGQGVGGKFDARIRRIAPSGIITTVVGSDHGNPPVPLTNGDGGVALQARLTTVWAIAIGPDGSIYYADEGNELLVGGVPQPGTGQYRVRRVRPDGLIQTVVGDGVAGNSGDNGPARRARIQRVEGIAFLPDGSLLISDDAKVRKVSPPLPGLAGGQTVIASADGTELYVFSPAGRILLTLDAVTRETIYTFAYNSDRQLISITDHDGRVTQVIRDAAGKPTAMVAPNGQETDVSVDASGQIAGLVGPDGRPIGIQIAANGLIQETVDQLGDTVARYQYDADGRVIGMTNPLGGVTTLDRNITPTGTQFVVQSPTGETSTLDVEELATGTRRLFGSLPDGTTSETTQDPDGRVVVRSTDGRVTTLVPKPDPRVGMQAPLTTTTVQLPSGLTRLTDERRAVVVDTTTQALISQTDTILLNGRASFTTYQASTRRDARTSAQGRRSFTTYDVGGRAVLDSVPSVLSSQLTYTGGLLTGASQGARSMSIGYDDFDYLDHTTDPQGFTTTFLTDENGRPSQVVRPNGSVLGFAHDARGNLERFTPPQRPSHVMSYRPGGLLASYTLPDVGAGPKTRVHTYDLSGRLASTQRADGSVLEFHYDSAGRPTFQVLPNNDTLRFVFSPSTGLLTSLQRNAGANVSLQYDGDLVTREEWSGPVAGVVNTTYDADFRPSSQTVNGANAITFGYDGDGILTSVGSLTLSSNPSNGAPTGSTMGVVATTLTYSPFGELSRLQATVSSAPFFDVQLTQDAGGRVVTRDETVAGVTTHYQFAYDSVGRLGTVTRDGLVAEDYDYDANGNRIAVATPAGSVVSSVDARDRLMTYANATYVFTEDGELLRRINAADTTRYTYDAVGNLRSVIKPDGTEIEYIIDGSNRRVGKRINGVLTRAWLYDGQSTPVAEFDGSGQLVCRYVYGARLIVPDFATCSGVTYRLIVDERGSLRFAINSASGEVWLRRDYDSFGQITLDTRPDFLPFGFAGGFFDGATGLTRFGARDYDAFTGRWTARDPIGIDGGDLNLYVYVGNDPINRIDPLGLEGTLTEEEFKAALREVLNQTSQRQLKIKIRRKVECWAVELVTDKVVDEVIKYGIYLFSDMMAGGLPYVGQSIDIARRAIEHSSAQRLAGPFRAIFGVDAGTKLREAEQFILDYLRKSGGLTDEALRFKNGGGVANLINPMNKADRAALRSHYNFCK